MNLKTLVVPFGLAALPFALSQCSSSDTDEPNDPTTSTNTMGNTSTATSSMTVSNTSAATTSPSTGTTSPSTGTTSPSTASSTGANSMNSVSSMGATSSSTTGSATTTGVGGGTMTGTTTGTGAGGSGAGGTGNVGGEFTLTSSELEEGAEFLPKHTCEVSGFDMDESPPLAWTGAPAAAMSFAVVFIDTTLTEQGNMNGYHWAMWDIPASVSELPANLPTGATLTTPVSAKQFNPISASYLGPCPNIGSSGNTDTYAFTVYAMPEAVTAELAGVDNVQQLEAAIKAVALDSATLTGTSDAVPPN